MEKFWQTCVQRLEQEIPPQQISAWIRPLTPLAYDEAEAILRVGAPNRFKLDWARANFSRRIEALAAEWYDRPVQVRFELDPNARAGSAPSARHSAAHTASAAGSMAYPTPGAPNAGAGQTAGPLQHHAPTAPGTAPGVGSHGALGPESANGRTGAASPVAGSQAAGSTRNSPGAGPTAASSPFTDGPYGLGSPRASADPLQPALDSHTDATVVYDRSRLNAELTFDNFVTGKANQLARAAALQVAENPGTSYNPLFLYGGVGLGKTHLIHAIGNSVMARNINAKVRYIHAEQFVSDVVKTYHRKSFDDFKRYYHALDLLLIDDIQFFSGKDGTQELFFYAFEAIVAQRRQIIITSDTYPKELSGIDERLISRFDSGLTLAIEPPELEMRVAILIRKAEKEGVPLPEEVAFFIAKHLRSNVRELEGALRKVLAYARFHGRPITVDVCKEALKDLLSVSHGQLTVENIQRTVADFYKIKVADMYSKRRPANIALPRQIAMYLSKELTQKSLPEIGDLFGGRDHTTVLHAVRKISEARTKQAELNHALHVLEQTLKG